MIDPWGYPSWHISSNYYSSSNSIRDIVDITDIPLAAFSQFVYSWTVGIVSMKKKLITLKALTSSNTIVPIVPIVPLAMGCDSYVSNGLRLSQDNC